MMKQGKTVVVTGSARRLGREIALSLADAGYSLVIHSTRESSDSAKTISDVQRKNASVKYIAADFSDPVKANEVFDQLFQSDRSLFALINNAAVFEGSGFVDSSFDQWNRNMAINLSTPYLISQSFARSMGERSGRIINMLDWRALRPGKDHFAYTISKSALAAMTKAMALALAPNISVNGLALGAILPPSDGGSEDSIIKQVPAGRWARLDEVTDAVKFALSGPGYLTGEIIHIDGGRHLV